MDLAAKVRATSLGFYQLRTEDEDEREEALKNLDERGSAQELVRQQYTGRYPFELLQNADDAARQSGRRGRARFILTDTALLVADDGSGFGEQQVKAICSLGRSPKGPGSSIGHKGLGFKSVGEITDKPQIISGGEQFQFDVSRVHADLKALFGTLPAGQRFPAYAFPYPLSRDDLGEDAEVIERLRADGFTTVVRLPLKDEGDRNLVAEHLSKNLQARLLLFLPSIDHLELRGTGHDFSAEVARQDTDGVERVFLESEMSSDEEWLVYRGSMVPSDEILSPMGEEWLDLKEVKFAIAVPLDPVTTQPLLDERYPLHVYFPTEENPGLRVAVHAEWILTMERTRIAHTPEATEFNRRLHEAVADFVRDRVAVDLVRRCGLSPASVQSLLPDDFGQSDGAARELAELWRDGLADVQFLPFANSNLGCATDVLLLPAYVPDPEAAHTFLELSPDVSLRPDIEAAEGVVDFVSAVSDDPFMEDAELLRLLKSPDLSVADEFYAFLIGLCEESPIDLHEELKAVKCVIASNGEVFAPAEQAIFFPRHDTSLPDDLPVPIAYVPEIPGIESLLRDLDVKSFQWRELINEYLIKILEREDADPLERDRAMRGLRAYQEARTTAGDIAVENLGRVLLPARKRTGSETIFRSANKTYFPSEWTGSSDLEEIYGPFNESEFLGIAAPTDPEMLDRERSFYQMLGVVDYPRIEFAGSVYKLDGYRKHAHSGPSFNEWLASVDARDCGQGHDTQYLTLNDSVRLDRQGELADSTDPRRLLALWNELARNWGRIYEPARYVTVTCNHRYHNGSRTRSVLSMFGYNLIVQPWVPVEIADELYLSCPSESWVETTAELPAHVRRRIPLISQTMYRTKGAPNMVAELGLIETAHPKIEDYLRFLETIADEADATGGVSHDIGLAARWVQRKINDALSADADSHPSPQDVRVLTRFREDTFFASQPLYASDPALRSTWHMIAPVMVADSGDTRFAKYLGLLKLDDAVQVSPVPLGERRDDLAVAIATRVNSAKPFIAALIHQNARTENRVLRILGSLELVFCERLRLVYRYRDEEIQVDNASCFVAVRQAREANSRAIKGTAYVVLDQQTGNPDWFALGRQLADQLDISTHADAITMLLKDDLQDRERMMAGREIPLALVSEAASKLDVDFEEDTYPSLLDQLLDQPAQLDAASVEDGWRPSESNSLAQADKVDPQSNERSLDSAERSMASPPPVNYSAVRMVDAIPQRVEEDGGGTRRSRDGMVVTRNSSAPSIQTDSEKRRIGKRGEEVVYNKERERLLESGLNPDSVVWHSATDELAPFDILSFDADGQRIYIEVKATTSSDPSEPFYISKSELIEAGNHGDRYYIYRVTDVDTEGPAVFRWPNPLRLVKSGQARLIMATAQMELGLTEPDA
jgi:hypothetical protein